MKFKREDLMNDEVYEDPISDVMVDHKRWAVVHQIVFERDGKFWRTTYEAPATESQEFEPWWEDEVECEEVELKEALVKRWEPVEN